MRRLHCDARPGVAPRNSLRDLRSLRSTQRGESVLDARCARRPQACASRRPRNRPCRVPPAAQHRTGAAPMCGAALGALGEAAVVGCEVRARIAATSSAARAGGECGRARVPAHSCSPDEPAGPAGPAVDVWRTSARPARTREAAPRAAARRRDRSRPARASSAVHPGLRAGAPQAERPGHTARGRGAARVALRGSPHSGRSRSPTGRVQLLESTSMRQASSPAKSRSH
jgi:hypothetical protein